jgi:hypothetical protein
MLGGSFAGICARLKPCKWLMGKRAPRQYGDKVEQGQALEPKRRCTRVRIAQMRALVEDIL